MWQKIKTWVKDKWVRFKKWLKLLLIPPALAMGAVGADVATFSVDLIPVQDVRVADEMVNLRQVGNVVEAEMPWKGESGITVQYDMGSPTVAERLADKRKAEVVTEVVPFGDDEGFKIDILLNEKPATNVFTYYLDGWEDYDFFYQPALTQEEIDEGAERPEEIVGSYAVYHKTLKNHKTSGVNYETGKFGHIPFPYVWEVGNEAGKVRAEDMTFTDGFLTVTVPQRFLDNAVYPVRVDPTFGYTTAGGSRWNNNSDYLVSSETLYNPGESGTGVSMSIHVNSGTPTDNYQMAVYTDASPADFVTDSDTDAVAVTSSTSEWKTANFTGSPSFNNQNYYLVWNSDSSAGGGDGVSFDDNGADDVLYRSFTYGTWPSTTTWSQYFDATWSIYVTYIPDGAVQVDLSDSTTALGYPYQEHFMTDTAYTAIRFASSSTDTIRNAYIDTGTLSVGSVHDIPVLSGSQIDIEGAGEDCDFTHRYDSTYQIVTVGCTDDTKMRVTNYVQTNNDPDGSEGFNPGGSTIGDITDIDHTPSIMRTPNGFWLAMGEDESSDELKVSFATSNLSIQSFETPYVVDDLGANDGAITFTTDGASNGSLVYSNGADLKHRRWDNRYIRNSVASRLGFTEATTIADDLDDFYNFRAVTSNSNVPVVLYKDTSGDLQSLIGDTATSSESSYTSDLINTPTWVSGGTCDDGDSCLSLNGSNEYVNTGANNLFNNMAQGSIDITFKRDSLGDGTEGLVDYHPDTGSYNGYELYLNSLNGGQVNMIQRGTGASTVTFRASTGAVVTEGDWVNARFAVNSEGNYMCINGSEVSLNYTTGSATDTEFFSAINTPGGDMHVRLGVNRRQNSLSHFLEGDIDRFAVWDVAKPCDVDYEGHLSGDETGLAFYHEFNEGTGTETQNNVVIDDREFQKVAVATDLGGGAGDAGYTAMANSGTDDDIIAWYYNGTDIVETTLDTSTATWSATSTVIASPSLTDDLFMAAPRSQNKYKMFSYHDDDGYIYTYQEELTPDEFSSGYGTFVSSDGDSSAGTYTGASQTFIYNDILAIIYLDQAQRGMANRYDLTEQEYMDDWTMVTEYPTGDLHNTLTLNGKSTGEIVIAYHGRLTGAGGTEDGQVYYSDCALDDEDWSWDKADATCGWTLDEPSTNFTGRGYSMLRVDPNDVTHLLFSVGDDMFYNWLEDGGSWQQEEIVSITDASFNLYWGGVVLGDDPTDCPDASADDPYPLYVSYSWLLTSETYGGSHHRSLWMMMLCPQDDNSLIAYKMDRTTEVTLPANTAAGDEIIDVFTDLGTWFHKDSEHSAVLLDDGTPGFAMVVLEPFYPYNPDYMIFNYWDGDSWEYVTTTDEYVTGQDVAMVNNAGRLWLVSAFTVSGTDIGYMSSADSGLTWSDVTVLNDTDEASRTALMTPFDATQQLVMWSERINDDYSELRFDYITVSEQWPEELLFLFN